jgi:hypothetical protein
MIDTKPDVLSAKLKASEPKRNRSAAMASRGPVRLASALRAAALLLGTITGPIFAQSWIQEAPDNSPPARYVSAMANDGASGKVMLFGGYGANPGIFLSDTWSWDGADWTQELPAHNPAARYGHAMAYDAAQGKVVLFGGVDSSADYLSDTWVWNGTDWTLETPAASPPARAYHAMKYDSASGKVILFGGFGDNTGGFSDTWLWDGSNWTQAEPFTSPSARAGSAMAYDMKESNVVLFGGVSKANSVFNDTWEWDGSDWIQQTPSVNPLGRYFAGMAYDSEEGKVVMFGGTNIAGDFSDTWYWDGTNWTSQSSPDVPGEREGLAMAPDAQGNVVMFGGYYRGLLSDTWVWTKSPQVSLNPTSLSFGKQKVKSSSAAKPVKLTNSGVNTLTIHSIAFTGSDSKDFQESNDCHGSLKPGFSCMIDVTFKPTAKGALSAKLVIKDNAQNSSQSATVSGTGD